MSKITFRADDDLVERLEALELSKSEAMREALREYLGVDAARSEGQGQRQQGPDRDRQPPADGSGAIDDLLRERVDELLDQRLREHGLESRSQESTHTHDATGVTISVSLPDDRTRTPPERTPDGRRARNETRTEPDRNGHGDRDRRGPGRDRDGHDQADRGRSPSPSATDDERKTHTDESVDNREPTAESSETQCGQCGESVADDHVYCPNCGEKTARRLFCECGDEVRSDWSFCPGCGRRTPAADVLGRDTPS